MSIRSLLVVASLALALPLAAEAKEKGAGALPPGLAKNQQRGKPLPPGWQKKLARGEVLDVEVYERASVVVPVDDRGLVTLRIEGKLVQVMQKTREIVEILD